MKTPVFAIIVSLLVWVAIDGFMHLNRSRRITTALAHRQIGLPSKPDEQAMSELIGGWLKIAGVNSDFAVDQPPKAGRLNIYFTTPGAFSATGVGYGNAAYDASVDSIFIDRFFVESSPYQALCEASPESSVLGCREHMSSQAIMLAFIFFHELGHRQLHHAGSSAFASRPNDPQLRRMETEADGYSLNQLKLAYDHGQPVVDDPDRSLADALSFGAPGSGVSEPRYQVWVDIFGALLVTTTLNSFLPAPYSPFYHDLAHPSLFERTRGLIDVALADRGLPANIRDQLHFLQSLMIEEARIPEVGFTEVTVPKPISRVAFTDTGLQVLTIPKGLIYKVPRSRLVPDRVSEAPKVVTAQPTIDSVKLTAAPLDFESIDLFWGYGAEDILATGSDGTWELRNQRLVPSTFSVHTNECFHWWSQPEPTPVGLARTCPAQGDTLTLTTQARILNSISVAGLENAVRQRLGNSNLELELLKDGDRQPAVTMTDHAVYIPIVNRSTHPKRYAGLLSLSLPALQPVQIEPLNLPNHLAELQPTRALFVARDSTGAPVTLVIGAGGGLKPLHWGVWAMSPDGKLDLVTERPFLSAPSDRPIGEGTIGNFDPAIVEVRDLGPGIVAINIGNDGVFLVDLEKRCSKLLYGLGGPAFRLTPSQGGEFALYVPGGGKIFIFTPIAQDITGGVLGKWNVVERLRSLFELSP